MGMCRGAACLLSSAFLFPPSLSPNGPSSGWRPPPTAPHCPKLAPRHRELDVSYNEVRRIENVGHLGALKRLFLANNKIKVIANLEGLPLLEMLELGANRIRVIENIPELPMLRSLFLGKNKITELAGIAHLSALRVLSVQVGPILCHLWCFGVARRPWGVAIHRSRWGMLL